MSVQPKYRYTPEEYLALEREAEYKSEYFDGEIFAMSGASRKHILIAGNIHAAFHRQLRKRRCEVYTSDMRVRVSETGLYTYPDVSVVCDTPVFDDDYSRSDRVALVIGNEKYEHSPVSRSPVNDDRDMADTLRDPLPARK